jgi:hypothetical protein
MPQLNGKLPEVDGLNPVPPPDSLTTSAGGFDWLGIAYGLNESVDIGFDFARGLHSVIRFGGGGHWAASVSPAFYWYRGREGNDVTSINVTALLALDPWPAGPHTADAYAGLGGSLYHASLAETSWATRNALVPTVLGGFRINAGCAVGCGRRPSALWLVGEAQGTWIEQRTGHVDFVPTLRVFMRLQGLFDATGRARRGPSGPAIIQ